ncbi:hypothetical protein ABZT23_38800, partial [Streptomyces sp. NPDC005386]
TEIRGRVLSASRLISLMGAPFGGILAGYLASRTSLRTPFITGGLLMIIVALASLPALSNHAIQQATNEATNETTPTTEPSEETTDTTPKPVASK